MSLLHQRWSCRFKVHKYQTTVFGFIVHSLTFVCDLKKKPTLTLSPLSCRSGNVMSKNKHIIHLLNEVVTERPLKMPWPNTSDQHVSVKDEDELRLLEF